VCYPLDRLEKRDEKQEIKTEILKKKDACKIQIFKKKEFKMLKVNLVEDWGPINRVPATPKDIMVVAAVTFAATGVISLILISILNLLFSFLLQRG
jgi:hypothetical protein